MTKDERKLIRKFVNAANAIYEDRIHDNDCSYWQTETCTCGLVHRSSKYRELHNLVQIELNKVIE